MKRFAKMLVAFFILITPITSSADSAATVTGNTTTAYGGDTVIITVNISNNPGLTSWQLALSWDTDVMILNASSVAQGSAFSTGTFVVNTNVTGKLYAAWANAEPVSQNGNMITLTFQIASNAASGTYPMTITTSSTMDQSGNRVTVAINNANITVLKNGMAGSTGGGVNNTSAGTPNVKPTEKESIQPPSINHTFSDLKEGAYYYDAALWAVRNGITNGTSSTAFSPKTTCNRAQAVTFLWRAAGSPEPVTKENPFNDVKQESYYYKAVLWALENGITKGTSIAEFSPRDTVTRAQTVTFLWRSSGSEKSTTSNLFSDLSGKEYYADSVQWAVANKITNGATATTFGPEDDCARGQMVTFLYRLHSL